MTQRRSPIGDGLRAIATALTTPPPVAPVIEDPELIQGWQLDLDHLGRLILIPPVNRWDQDRDVKADAVTTIGGRLVGYRATPPVADPRPASQPTVPTRILVIQQGSHIGEVRVNLTQTVHVAPRAWS